MRSKGILLGAALASLLAGCAGQLPPPAYSPPQRAETRFASNLYGLPAPTERISVAVYQFEDQTGQRRRNEKYADISSAVTQGGAAFLVNALKDVGRGTWFQVVERQGVENLLKERQIIRQTRDSFGDKTPLPPMLFAGMIVEGGITAYESNTSQGGFGARVLGIGGNTEWRRDQVTVNLRAVSVQSGEVVVSLSTSKSVLSALVSANVFRYVSEAKILEVDAGAAVNEPVQMAVREAIEAGVLELVARGAEAGLWRFQDAGDAARVKDAFERASRVRAPAPAGEGPEGM